MPTPDRFRVLVLGAHGFFGTRLVERLAGDARLHLLLGRRNPDARAACAWPATPRAIVEPWRIDLSHADFAQRIGASGAHAVVHLAGPFQGQDYAVARASIAARAHYLDLADGRRYVAGIGTLDADARAAGVLVASGASSVPALSGAAIEALVADGMQPLEIDIGIAPGNRSTRGLATVAGVMSYCGERVTGWRDGAPRNEIGWQSLRSERYPEPAGARWLACCDVPDLQLLPALYPGVRSVRFGAGTELRWMMLALWLMAALRRARLVPGWARSAGLLKRASDALVRFGSDVGAMHVRVTGRDPSGPVRTRQWTLVAEGGDGPWIPVCPAAALVRKLAAGAIDIRGARACVGLLSLAEIEAEFAGLAIRTTRSES